MSAMITDLVLVTDIRSGSEKAFLLVYRKFHEKLYFYFLQKIRSEDVSEELVQLTYIKLWQYRQNLNPQLPVAQQIFRIAKTTLIDVLRKKAANKLVPIDNQAPNSKHQAPNNKNQAPNSGIEIWMCFEIYFWFLLFVL